MQINFNSSVGAGASLRGLDRCETAPQLKAALANRAHRDGADDLQTLVRAAALAWRIEAAVWLALAASAVGALLLSFSLAG
jgi:hypothetical protein